MTISADSTRRPASRSRSSGGPWYTTASVDARPRRRHRRRGGRRRVERRRRARRGDPLRRHVRHLRLVDAVTLRAAPTRPSRAATATATATRSPTASETSVPPRRHADAKVDTTAPARRRCRSTSRRALVRVRHDPLLQPAGLELRHLHRLATSADPSPAWPASTSRTSSARRRDRLHQPVLERLLVDCDRHRVAAPRPSRSRTARATTSTGTFTVTPDTTPPTGQTVSLGGGTWYATQVDLTLDDGRDCRLRRRLDERRRRARLRHLLRGSLRRFSGSWSAVTLAAAPTTRLDGHCYRYRYTSPTPSGTPSPPPRSAVAKVDARCRPRGRRADRGDAARAAQYWKPRPAPCTSGPNVPARSR